MAAFLAESLHMSAQRMPGTSDNYIGLTNGTPLVPGILSK